MVTVVVGSTDSSWAGMTRSGFLPSWRMLLVAPWLEWLGISVLRWTTNPGGDSVKTKVKHKIYLRITGMDWSSCSFEQTQSMRNLLPDSVLGSGNPCFLFAESAGYNIGWKHEILYIFSCTFHLLKIVQQTSLVWQKCNNITLLGELWECNSQFSQCMCVGRGQIDKMDQNSKSHLFLTLGA